MQMITISAAADFGRQGGTLMSMSAPSQQERIRRLNDSLRTTFISGRVMLTAGVRALSDEERVNLLRAVSTYDDFTPANDPYGEHDFGRVEVGGCGYFFKIDYYDLDLLYHSPDPIDAAVTARVMTIMREDEY